MRQDVAFQKHMAQFTPSWPLVHCKGNEILKSVPQWLFTMEEDLIEWAAFKKSQS